MKKISLLILAAFGLLFAACEETIEPAKPQVNPQEPLMTDGDIVTEPAGVLLQDEVLNLEDYATANIPVVKLISAENLPAGASVNYVLQLSATEDFAKYEKVELATQLNDDSGIYYADSYDWNDAHLELFGNTINVCDAYYRVAVYVTLDGTRYRYNSPDYYAVEGGIEETRMTPAITVEENYYVFGPFVGNNSAATAVVMSRDEEQDRYDNPVYTFQFDVTADQAATGYTLYIVPESARNSSSTTADYYGLGSTSDVLVLGGEPIAVTEEGPYILEFNAETKEYQIKMSPNFLYVVTTQQSDWSKLGVLGTSDYVNYEGMTGIMGYWGLTGQQAYTPTAYMKNPNVEVTTADNGARSGGLLFDNSGEVVNTTNGIPVPGTTQGLFFLKANLQTLTYTGYRCGTLGFVGTINNWGNANDDGSVTPDVALRGSWQTDFFLTWTGTLTVKAGDEWKIRANSAWDVNFGGVAADGQETASFATDGSNVELVMGGANFKAEADGTYNVTVHFHREYKDGAMTPYYMTLTPAQ